jgi:hypothetical protein
MITDQILDRLASENPYPAGRARGSDAVAQCTRTLERLTRAQAPAGRPPRRRLSVGIAACGVGVAGFLVSLAVVGGANRDLHTRSPDRRAIASRSVVVRTAMPPSPVPRSIPAAIRVVFPVFAIRRTREDKLPASAALTHLQRRYDINPALSRLVAVTPTMPSLPPQRVWVVPGHGYLCEVVSARRQRPLCLPDARAFVFGIVDRTISSAGAVWYGLLPRHASEVKLVAADGSTERVAVRPDGAFAISTTQRASLAFTQPDGRAVVVSGGVAPHGRASELNASSTSQSSAATLGRTGSAGHDTSQTATSARPGTARQTPGQCVACTATTATTEPTPPASRPSAPIGKTTSTATVISGTTTSNP